MKKQSLGWLVLLLAVVFSVGFASCDKDDDEEDYKPHKDAYEEWISGGGGRYDEDDGDDEEEELDYFDCLMCDGDGICYFCHGDGIMSSGRDCDYCDGSGLCHRCDGTGRIYY